MSVDEQFNATNEKLRLLLKQHNKLQKENEQLQSEVKQAFGKLAGAQQVIEQLNQEILILKVSNGEMKEADKKEFEKRLNQYLKEVDRCIAFLSE